MNINILHKLSIIFTILAVLLVVTATPTTADTTKPEVSLVNILSVTSTTETGRTETIDKIHIYFSKPMNPATIHSQTIMVNDRVTLNRIRGTITYDQREQKATFHPQRSENNLQSEGNEFIVTITTGAEDVQGNALAQDAVWEVNVPAQTATNETTVSTTNQPPVREQTTTPVEQDQGVQTLPERNAMYTLGALVILALLSALIILAATRRRTTRKKIQTKNPFGAIYPISTIEGIGPVYTKKLNKIGIINTKQLWESDARTIARKVDSNTKTVTNWQQMAELTAVHGIGPQYAELLERSGIGTIAQLAKKDAQILLTKIQRTQNALKINIQGNTIGKDIVTSWISEANKHVYAK